MESCSPPRACRGSILLSCLHIHIPFPLDFLVYSAMGLQILHEVCQDLLSMYKHLYNSLAKLTLLCIHCTDFTVVYKIVCFFLYTLSNTPTQKCLHCSPKVLQINQFFSICPTSYANNKMSRQLCDYVSPGIMIL